MSKETKSPIKPLGDRVVIRPLAEEESGSKSASGIIIPDSAAKEKNDEGIIVAIGPGKWDEDGEKRIPMETKAGDRVIFKSWSEKVKVDKNEYWVVTESEILGVVV
tara:strand:+ start:672 stop:989 length:318 start_codon:yes stop_codon:yes gene_type:complete